MRYHHYSRGGEFGELPFEAGLAISGMSRKSKKKKEKIDTMNKFHYLKHVVYYNILTK